MKLWYSFTKELKLASKGFYFYVEIIMAILMLVILLVLIPENFVTVQEEYLHLTMPEAMLDYYQEAFLEKDEDGVGEAVILKDKKEEIPAILYETPERKVYVFETIDDMIRMTEADHPYIGAELTYDENEGGIIYNYYLQGYEATRLKNLLKIFHIKDTTMLEDLEERVPVRTLELGHEPLNSRETALPALLTFNGSLMGVFIIAAYIFLDKEEGIIKAYAITASKVWMYLMSKVLVLIIVSIATTMAVAIPIMGMRASYGYMIILLITSAFFSSSLGLLISTFFDNMMKAFGAVYVVMMAMLIPAFSYFLPSWEPLFVKFLPTYYLIMGFKETIVNQGDMNFVLIASLFHLLIGVVLFFWSNHRFKKTLVY